MKKITRLAAFALCLAVIAPSCKKYEEGPSLSLRSKKARVAGEWTVSSILEESSNTSTGGSDVTRTESTDGSTLSETSTSTPTGGTADTDTRTGTIAETYTFEKDGNYASTSTRILTSTETQTLGGSSVTVTVEETKTTTASGLWNFTGGVGEAKKKQNMILDQTASTTTVSTKTTTTTTVGGSSTTTVNTDVDNYTNTLEGSMTVGELEIVLLKNKEMKLRYNATGSSTSSSNGGTASTNGNVNKMEVTLKQ